MDKNLKNEIVLSSIMKSMTDGELYSIKAISETTGLSIPDIKKCIRSADFNELRIDYGIDKMSVSATLSDLMRDPDPKVRLSTISEINKMSGDYKTNINVLHQIDPNIRALQSIYADVEIVDDNLLLEENNEEDK